MAKSNKEGNKSDKKRKNRKVHSGNPRIAKSKGERRCTPYKRLEAKLNLEKKNRKNMRPSVASEADLRRWLKTEPTEQELMLQAKYAE